MIKYTFKFPKSCSTENQPKQQNKQAKLNFSNLLISNTRMTEILIGQHCSISTCNQLDFLPFTCRYCNKVFCRHHKDITSHQCEQYERVASKLEGKPQHEIVRYKCSFGDCKNTESVSVSLWVFKTF